MTTVMQNVRDYARGTHLASAPPPVKSSIGDDLHDLEKSYEAHVRTLLLQEDFTGLEAEVHRVREFQARLVGGAWKLFCFYQTTSEAKVGQADATEQEWQAQISRIKKWIAAYPTSASARITLADTYISYAWAARGSGYSNTVSKAGWSTFDERIELAKSVLLDAAQLKEKCPFWFEAMQNVALAQGWDKSQARELFDRAVDFAPSYYHFYREYANFLLPKWYGKEGETQAFAEEATKRMDAPYGNIIYFEIASLLACQCDKERDSLSGMDWPKVKQGYSELVNRYGATNLKSNRFAYMSFVAGDKSSAQGAFASVGNDWHPRVWRSAENFAAAKKWALSE